MQIDGKTAVVTGGASGIGAAIVRHLASRNVRVFIADYAIDDATALARDLGNGVSAHFIDVSDVESVEDLADEIGREAGGVDFVFANAGVCAPGNVLDATQDAFDWQFAVNVRGVWATVKSFTNRMVAAGRSGHVTITASEHALGMQHLGTGIYTCTKHAVLGLAEMLRAETPETFGVSVFCPGLVATKLNEAERFGVVARASAEEKAVGAAVMNKGMSADEIASFAIKGTERGDFYIVTHATSYAAAEKRFAEIKSAFASQAPMTDEAKQYDVNVALASVMSELEKRD